MMNRIRPAVALRQLVARQSSNVAAADAVTTTVKRLNHVAIAVPDLPKAATFYRHILGVSNVSTTPQDLPEHGVSVLFVRLQNMNVELLHPFPAGSHASPIAKFLERNPRGGLHHLCFEVSNVERTLAHVKQSGLRVIDEHPKIGAHGTPVAFLHPQDCGGVLVELEQVR